MLEFSTKKLQKEVDAIYKMADTSTRELQFALGKQLRAMGDKEIAEQGLNGYTLCTPCEEYLHMVMWIKDGNNNLCFAINSAKKQKEVAVKIELKQQTEKEIEDDDSL